LLDRERLGRLALEIAKLPDATLRDTANDKQLVAAR